MGERGGSVVVAQWLLGERESGSVSVVDHSSDRADLGLTLGGVVSCVGGGAAGFSLSLSPVISSTARTDH